MDHFEVWPIDGNYVRCALTPKDGLDLRPPIFQLVKQHSWELRELTRKTHSLEDIYVQLTRPDEEDEA